MLKCNIYIYSYKVYCYIILQCHISSHLIVTHLCFCLSIVFYINYYFYSIFKQSDTNKENIRRIDHIISLYQYTYLHCS